MLDRIPKQEKIKFTIYIPPEMAKTIKQRALDQGKTISKYISDIVREDDQR